MAILEQPLKVEFPDFQEVLQLSYLSACSPEMGLPLLPTTLNLDQVKQADFDAILHASITLPPAKTLLATRQLYSLVLKNRSFGTETDKTRAAAAIKKFIKVQRRNSITEKRLNFYLFKHPFRMRPNLGELMGTAQMELYHLLGDGPSQEDWASFVSGKVWGPGVVQGLQPILIPTTSAKKPKGKMEFTRIKDVNAYGKLALENTITTTAECLRTFGPVLLQGQYGSYLLNNKSKGRISEASEGTTVPKSAVIDRFIATEPLLNTMAQQGISAMLDKYLRLWGIFLQDQSLNRQLAREASDLGFSPKSWSTIDLSSASDTVTEVLVRYLLPRGWYVLLNAARTKGCSINGEVVPNYCSFSTMGNAFTFPLQCLIFCALTRAAMKLSGCWGMKYRVYGDDIIAPLGSTLVLIEALRFAGFSVNTDKSFITGFFRESCGGDYLAGEDVRPIYLDESLRKRNTRHVLFNQLQRVLPAHPVLNYLLEGESRPLIGPATHPYNIDSRWYEAPMWMVAKFGHWNKDLQCYEYRLPGLTPTSRRYKRRDVIRAYLADLSGNGIDKGFLKGRYHDLRGTVTFHVREARVFGGCRLREYSPYWYYA